MPVPDVRGAASDDPRGMTSLHALAAQAESDRRTRELLRDLELRRRIADGPTPPRRRIRERLMTAVLHRKAATC